MQPGGRRGDGPAGAREHGLITLGIRGLDLALEVRRQRKFARGVEVDRAAELDDAFALRANIDDHSRHVAHMHDRAGAHLPAGLHEALPGVRAHRFEEEQLDAPVVGIDPRRHDARVVQHDDIPRRDERGEVAERAVFDAL